VGLVNGSSATSHQAAGGESPGDAAARLATTGASEYLLRETQRVASIGTYQLDFTTQIWSSSETLDELFGIDRDAPHTVVAWLDLVHPDDRQELARHFTEDVFAARHPFRREYRVVRPSDGGTRWVSGLGELRYDASGGLLFMVGTIQDITARRSLEADLVAREERHAAILRTAMDGVTLRDAEGRFLEVNDTFCRMTGYSADELRTMRIHDLDATDTPAEASARIEIVTSRGEARFEARHRRKDGSVFDAEVSVRHQPGVGGGYAVAFVRDISAQKRAEVERAKLEADLRQAQKVESIGRLAGGIAHDFNNMLGAILGYVELAVDQTHPGESLHADLLEIRRAAERSAALTRQLLAFARKQTVAPKSLGLNDAVTGLLRMLERVLGEQIELHWRPDADPCTVKIDPSQLDEILVNLCVNARDAIDGPGEITLETALVTVDAAHPTPGGCASPGEYVRLTVTDSGAGMDEATLAHIFEPFFTTKEVGKGTGLGLATVHGAVSQNGGFIEVRSAPDAGTTFSIYLPRHGEEGAPASRHSVRGVPLGRGTVLVVEDEPALLRLTASVLSRQGYTVIEASSPGEGLQQAESHEGAIDLLVTDVVMPGMNGRDLASGVVARHPEAKVLFMSGYTSDVIAPHGVLDGNVHFLQKPFSVASLVTKARDALEGRRAT